jgi:hypothetical protein
MGRLVGSPASLGCLEGRLVGSPASLVFSAGRLVDSPTSLSFSKDILLDGQVGQAGWSAWRAVPERPFGHLRRAVWQVGRLVRVPSLGGL